MSFRHIDIPYLRDMEYLTWMTDYFLPLNEDYYHDFDRVQASFPNNTPTSYGTL